MENVQVMQSSQVLFFFLVSINKWRHHWSLQKSLNRQRRSQSIPPKFKFFWSISMVRRKRPLTRDEFYLWWHTCGHFRGKSFSLNVLGWTLEKENYNKELVYHVTLLITLQREKSSHRIDYLDRYDSPPFPNAIPHRLFRICYHPIFLEYRRGTIYIMTRHNK